MNEEFIYIAMARNIHTGERYIKVGYTANIIQRIEQLQKRNKHFEYSHVKLFKHNKKLLGYIHDEQRIHRANTKYRANLKRDVMPEGNTECYESYHTSCIINQLSKLGYVCVYDEQEETKPQLMFEWN
ncbi:hypothetical protein DN619_31665 [Klebsiella michiganensis]|uniref:GIY-YIG nuclease family protein n=1 Tax=Klebsiella michiganensis TaxID=1134687 RepID=UPI000FEB749A|nr:GIY-YIG nuclease family protein [Klebsiella michiganensis]RWT36261.1 hypothetical protein DN619_31665 [Klebsiella michiganensis]